MISDNPTLEKFAGNVSCEVDMLKFTAARLIGMEPSLERNTFIESFLTHVRNLYWFFGDSPQQKDIVAKYYAGDSWKNDSKFPAFNKIGPDVITKINKLLAHLTLEREEYVDRNDTDWKIEEMTGEIMKVWNYFLSKLPKVKQEWFKKYLTSNSPSELQAGEIRSASTSVTTSNPITFTSMSSGPD